MELVNEKRTYTDMSDDKMYNRQLDTNETSKTKENSTFLRRKEHSHVILAERLPPRARSNVENRRIGNKICTMIFLN